MGLTVNQWLAEFESQMRSQESLRYPTSPLYVVGKVRKNDDVGKLGTYQQADSS